MVRAAGVGVGDGHVGEGEAVEERPGVVMHIVEDHAFALVEADFEVPFLPADELAELGEGGYCEGGALGLDDVEGLEVGAEGRLGFGDVLAGRHGLPWRERRGLGVVAGRKDIDADQLEG